MVTAGLRSTLILLHFVTVKIGENATEQALVTISFRRSEPGRTKTRHLKMPRKHPE